MCRPPATRRWLATLAFLFLGLLGLRSQADEPKDAPPPVNEKQNVDVQRDDAQRIRRITIASNDGLVAWNDVLQGLANAEGLDGAALQNVIPKGKIDITQPSSRYTILAVDFALRPEIRVQILPANDTRPEPALQLTVDAGKLSRARRNAKARIRDTFNGAANGGKEHERFGLAWDEGWEATPAGQPLVLVVHGINSSPDQVGGLVTAVRDNNRPVGTFAYPNDQPIADSAKRLSRDLKQFAADHPQRRLALVTHSMGGLVARAAIENADLDPGNVVKLIMVAPPTHGSQLARVSLGVDLWEHFLRPSEEKRIRRFFSTIEDGLSEADHDLRPDSDFLRELNARARNKQVRYSLFLGTGGPLTEQHVQLLRDKIEQTAKANRAVQLVRPKLEEIFSDFDEVVDGLGDGAVAVKRGRLSGVEDTVVLAFSHTSPTGDNPTDADRQLYAAIEERLAE